MDKKILSISTLCLLIPMFVSATTSLSEPIGPLPYDPWADLNDDGLIDIDEAIYVALRFGAIGTPVNKTELLYNVSDTLQELRDEIGALKKGGFIGAPAYDSGWTNITAGEILTFTHNLDTTEVFVYLLERNPEETHQIHQLFYGGDHHYASTYGCSWRALTNTTIDVHRYPDDGDCQQVRVRIWKIQPTP